MKPDPGQSTASAARPGKGPRKLITALGQHRKELHDLRKIALPFRATTDRVCPHLEILEHGEGLENLTPFRNMRDPKMRTLGRRNGKQILAVELSRCRKAVDDAGDRLEKRGFTRAVRTDDRDELAFGHVVRNIDQRLQSAIGDRE